MLEAPDLRAARRAAQAALAERSGEERGWSLGVLRPLTPKAPGTHRYRITFAVWQAEEDRFVRHDVHRLEVWAADATGARRVAQQQIQAEPDYQPAWRIRDVSRIRGRGGKRR